MNWLLALGAFSLTVAFMILGCAWDDGDDDVSDSDVGPGCTEFCRILYKGCDTPMEAAGEPLSQDECGFGCDFGGYEECAATAAAEYDDSNDCEALAASFADCANGEGSQ
jgi:hypothetical protein